MDAGVMTDYPLDVLKGISSMVEDATFKMLQPTGKFYYQLDVRNGQPIVGEYNLLRHFGTLWYLGNSAHNAQRAYAIKGLLWADKNYLQITSAKTAAYYYKKEIKTGGVALAMLAKISLGAMAHINKLSQFLLSVQKPNGDFIHKLDIQLKDSGFVSEYYTGEILFALATLEKVQPDAKRLAAILKSITYLMSLDYGIKEQSHWMLYALMAIYRITHDNIYVVYSNRIVQHILEHRKFQTRGANPIGCRVEGLLANAKMLKEQSPASDEYRKHFAFMRENIALMLAYQANGYFHNNGVCQIDGNQHCGTALRDYIRLVSV